MTGIIEPVMSEVGLHPLESILRLCAAAAPEPWYPRLFAKQEGVDPKELGRCLEELWLSGLIERADGGPEKGPAISLTREGQRVLLDPEALQRLRAGQPISSNDRAAVVRQALRGRMRPHITLLLLALNIVIFITGYKMAEKVQADTPFLRGAPLTEPYAKVLEKTGAITAPLVIEGQSWRLLTAGFVHIGFLHLLMNMTGLFLIGRFIEPMWGHLRYLVIYLVALLGGSCLGVAHHADGLHAGASGAICGIFAAEAVWFLLNRRYLPRTLLRRARTGFILTLILLIFISSFPNVSGWGHFGGAAAGAMAAMLLHLHRFGPPIWRWLAILGFVPLAWYGRYAIDRARATDPKWQEVERYALAESFAVPITKTLAQSKRVYKDSALPVLEKHPSRRKASEVEPVQAELAQQRDKLQALDDDLARFGPLFSPNGERKKLLYRRLLARQLELLDAAEQALRNGTKWPSPAEREQSEFENHYWRRTDSTLTEAMAVYRQRIRLVLDMDPSQRGAAAVREAQAALTNPLLQARDLEEELKLTGRYEDETAESARKTALRYTLACLELLDFCKEQLNSGSKEIEALDQHEKNVEEYRLKWKDLVE